MTPQERNFFRRQPLRLLNFAPGVLLAVLIYCILMAWWEANLTVQRFRASEAHQERMIDLGEIDSTGKWRD